MAKNFLIEALPPEIDYITYLTLIEYSLTVEQLDTLHEVLQDPTLTNNIGWDLVHILLPLLPFSAQCLQDVARLGNPREVILKVTELVQALGVRIAAGDEEGSDGAASETEQEHRPPPTYCTKEDDKLCDPSLRLSASASSVAQYSSLLDMLSILHPRITTKYPSRFLSTSLQTVLPVYSQLSDIPEATSAVLSLVKVLVRFKRPPLPPRKSSTLLATTKGSEAGQADPLDRMLGLGDAELSNRLLQAFLTHVLEEYMNALRFADDIPALAWTSRLQEDLHPDKVIPSRKTVRKMFSDSKILQERDEVTLSVTNLAQDLHVEITELLSVIMSPEAALEKDNDDLPSAAADVPLSHSGSLYLLSATIAARVLHNVTLFIPTISIFPHHAAILENSIIFCPRSTIGMQSEATIDSILFIGCYAVSKSQIGSSNNDAEFKRYLHNLSTISSDTPSPTLRYHAHNLLTTILRSHPSPSVRYNFIREILEQDEHENLKVSAVSWFKDELLTLPNERVELLRQTPLYSAFQASMPQLFPNVPSQFRNLNLSDQRYALFQQRIPFYLASLNLLYLLSFSPYRERLETGELCKSHDVQRTFLDPLASTCRRLTDMLDEQVRLNAIDEGEAQAQKMNLMLVENMLQVLAGRGFGGLTDVKGIS